MKTIIIFLILFAIVLPVASIAGEKVLEQIEPQGRKMRGRRISVRGRELPELPEKIKALREEAREKSRLDEIEASENLSGREVIVRVYSNWPKNRSEYEKIFLRMEGCHIPSYDFNEMKVGVVLKGDQEDEVVKEYLEFDAKKIYYKGSIGLVKKRPAQPKHRWVFSDGLGNPLVLAELEILDYVSSKKKYVKVKKILLDEQGQFEAIRFGGMQPKRRFVVSHPDYGIYGVNLFAWYKDWEYRIPKVKKGTESYKSAIRGFVVDDANNPISGASIKCWSLYTPRGAFVRSFDSTLYNIFTDKKGWFFFYLPRDEDESKTGIYIPLGSKYNVRIEAPNDFGFVPFVGTIPNDKECMIKLDEYGYYHTFVFENKSGRITDPKKLRGAFLSIERDGKPTIEYEPKVLRNGGYFPLGKYKTRIYDCEFEPIEVTEDSTEELVFKAIEEKNIVVYQGRVVHGITSEPMKGAFVIAKGGHYFYRDKFAQITHQQWEAMEKVGDTFPEDKDVSNKMSEFSEFRKGIPIDPKKTDLSERDIALQPIMRRFGSVKGVRTDSEGMFEMSFTNVERFSSIIAFKEDYLAVELRRVYFSEPDQNSLVKIKTIPLYPAAKVVINPCAENGRPKVCPYWVFDANNNPSWVGTPYEVIKRRKRELARKFAEDNLSDVNLTDVNFAEHTGWTDDTFEVSTSFYVSLYSKLILDVLSNNFTFFGIPLKIRKNYNYLGVDNSFKFEPNENIVWETEDFNFDLEKDLNRIPALSEIAYQVDASSYGMPEIVFTYNNEPLYLNKPQAIHVPAGVNLKLSLLIEDDFKREWVPIHIPKDINLKQGDTLELGTFDIVKSMQVFVKVVDPEGEPLENVPVKNWFDGYGYEYIERTNKDGIVQFNVYPHTIGKFYVSLGEEAIDVKDSIPYIIGGAEDTGREFTLTLSKEILEELYK